MLTVLWVKSLVLHHFPDTKEDNEHVQRQILLKQSGCLSNRNKGERHLIVADAKLIVQINIFKCSSLHSCLPVNVLKQIAREDRFLVFGVA